MKRATPVGVLLQCGRGQKELKRMKFSMNTAGSTNGALPGSIPGKSNETLFLRGVGRQLAHFLNDHSIRNRKGETWHDATVGAILHNPLYMGTLRKRRGMSGGLG